MKRILNCVLILVIVTMFAIAMSAQTSNTQENSQMTKANSNPATLTGCLSGAEGTYILLDRTSGVAYILNGDNQQLSKHVNQEIEVHGQPQVSTAKLQTTSNAVPATVNNFKVLSVKQTSNICQPPPAQ